MSGEYKTGSVRYCDKNEDQKIRRHAERGMHFMIGDHIAEMVVSMIHTEIRLIVNGHIVKRHAGSEEKQDPFFTDARFETVVLIGSVCTKGKVTEAEQWMKNKHGMEHTARWSFCWKEKKDGTENQCKSTKRDWKEKSADLRTIY